MTRPTINSSTKDILNTIDIDVEQVRFKAYLGRRDLECVNLMEGIQSIGYQSFQSCENLGAIKLPLTTVNVCGYAYCDCRSAKNIILNDGLVNIFHHAFMGCTSVVEVEIPATVSLVGNEAFKLCTGLKEARFVTCPDTIGTNVFSECPNLERIVSMSTEESKIEKIIPKEIPMKRVEAKDGWTLVYERVQEPATNNVEPETKPAAVANKLDNTTVLAQTIAEAKLAITRIENESIRSLEAVEKQRDDLKIEIEKMASALEQVFTERNVIKEQRDKLEDAYEKLNATNKKMTVELGQLLESNDKIDSELAQLRAPTSGGAPAATPAFGRATPAFASTAQAPNVPLGSASAITLAAPSTNSSGFGATPLAPPAPVFGATRAAPIFGSNPAPALFVSPPATGFGATPAPSANNPPPAPFGSTGVGAASSGFGVTPSAPAPAASTPVGGFGVTPAPAPFGITPGGFGPTPAQAFGNNSATPGVFAAAAQQPFGGGSSGGFGAQAPPAKGMNAGGNGELFSIGTGGSSKKRRPGRRRRVIRGIKFIEVSRMPLHKYE